MNEKKQEKDFHDLRKDIDIAKKTMLDYSQECQEKAEKETDPFRKEVLTTFGHMGVQMEDLYRNIEVLLVANHIVSKKFEDLADMILGLKEVKNNHELSKHISEIRSRDY
ncbi:MAG TPA: hypothetical protein VFR61_08405 [Nitrososphaeraceae archaeon]|jgi:hypothetical protein|nr:hypothetical protein [Nitrososphaeraceae archaeon]